MKITVDLFNKAGDVITTSMNVIPQLHATLRFDVFYKVMDVIYFLDEDDLRVSVTASECKDQ